MNGDPLLLARLLAAMALALVAAAALARGLGRPLRREVVVVAVALPTLLLLPWIVGDRLLLPTGNLARNIPGTGVAGGPDAYARVLNDVSLQFAPWEIEVRRQLEEGRLPLWSDRVNGGSSPLANPQAAVLSPISMLARLLPARHHFLGQLAIRIELALLGAWVAARLLGVGRRASLLGAASFAIGGGILAWGLFPHGSGLAWTPWCLASGISLARRPRPAAFVVAVASVTALMLSGQPEIAFAAGTLAAVAALLYARRRARVRAVARVAVVGALAFGFAAPALVPFLAVVPGSQRTADREVEFERHREESSTRSRRSWWRTQYARILAAPLTPWSDGIPYSDPQRSTAILVLAGYSGIVALAGLAAALAFPRARRVALPMAAVTLGLYLFGSRAPGLAWIWRHVPVLQLQEPTRIVPIGALCLALTGAIGLDALLRRRRSAGIGKVAAIGAALAVGLILAPDLRVGLVSAGIVLAAAAARRTPRAAMTLLAIALVADLIPWGRLLLPSGDPRLFYPRTDALQSLIRAAGGPGGRAVGHDRQVYPGILSTYGLDDPRTHDPLAAAAYHRVLDAAFGFAPSSWNYFGKFEDPQHPLLDFLGVRAVFSHVHLPAIPGMRRIPLTPPFFVAVNGDALSRAFVTRDFEIVRDEDLPRWIAGMTDPKRVALFAEEPVKRLQRSGSRRGDARIVDSSDGRVTIEVSGRGPRLLATSFRGPEGWRARSDGERLDTVTVNGAFLGVVVPSKTRKVELVYRPPGLALGLLLAAASALASALLLARTSRRPTSNRVT